MQTFIQELPEFNPVFPPSIDQNRSVFFDIETTGLSPASSFLYLIGCVFRENGRFRLIQWFSDDVRNEKELLAAFTEWISRFRCLIHYNGTAFDIPYLTAKCRKHQIAFDFNSFESIDIYKRILPYRRYIPAPNLKQRSMEEFLGISREDPFSGQDLIAVYTAYLGRSRYEAYHTGPSEESPVPSPEQLSSLLGTQGRIPDISAAALRSLLLGHNREDVKHLPALLSLLAYADCFRGGFVCDGAREEADAVQILLCCTSAFPVPLTAEFEAFAGTEHACRCSLTLSGERAVLWIPVFEGEVRHYYENYKDYYYLTEEGMISHKSVAAYVSPRYRRKARPEECYYKKSGRFLPQAATCRTPYYVRAYKQKITYFEVTEEFLLDLKELTQYARHILACL